jgi:hypothetical protein
MNNIQYVLPAKGVAEQRNWEGVWETAVTEWEVEHKGERERWGRLEWGRLERGGDGICFKILRGSSPRGIGFKMFQ